MKKIELEEIKREKFDFKENSVEIMDLDTLKRTYAETNPITLEPLKGIHHYQLIDRIAGMLNLHGIKYEIKEIFAAQNKDKNTPGVVIAPHIEKEFGKGAVEAHCLRRIYTTIQINDNEDDDSNTGLVIAYHQDGIQIAIGPNIKMCHNQCILSPERYVSTYGGASKVKDLEKLLNVVDDWLHNFDSQRQDDISVLQKMRTIMLTYRDVAELVGHLNFIRVGSDCHMTNDGKYPLSQGQISDFTEAYLRQYNKLLKAGDDTVMSLYEVYNLATTLYKPELMNIPTITTQNLAWTDMLINKFGLC
jgi:hypothetical protein